MAMRRRYKSMLHFAYGSNMCAALMRWRCPGARLEGRAYLSGYRFIIMRCGYASVVLAPGSCVHGLLWRGWRRRGGGGHADEELGGGFPPAAALAGGGRAPRCPPR